MFRFAIITCLSLAFAGNTWAQAQNARLPADLQNLPDEIKNLKWQNIDMSSVPTLEHCRALLLMNHVLEELSANATAEADLMSTYIEKQNLGSQFANTAPPPAAPQLGYPDAEKISVALLRGPMSSSYYATELSSATPGGLAAYAETYERTCQRRWAEFDEGRHLVRCMSSFLGNNQKLADYEGWATAEVALRQKQYEQRPGATPAAQPMPAGQAQSNAQMQQLAMQNQQLHQALAAAEAQHVSQAQMQTPQGQPQAAAPAQQQQQPQSGGCAAGYVAAPVYGGYAAYGGYGAYGAAATGAYVGATAANNANAAANNANNAANSNKTNVSPAAAAAAGQYHGANSTYNHDSAYNSAARSQTEQRMNNFHGGGGGGARR